MNESEYINAMKYYFRPQFFKVAEKKEYLEDFVEGKLYMKASGYFRKVEDDYRGDKYDGKTPINAKMMQIVIEDPETKSRFSLYNNSSDTAEVVFGFVGDERIPIFCMALLTFDQLQLVSGNLFRIKLEYVTELSKFGRYFTFVDAIHMSNMVKMFNEQHSGIYLMSGKMEYYNLNELTILRDDPNNGMGPYQSFFKKRDDYRNQNEWRIVAHSEKTLLKHDEDCLSLDIGKLSDNPILPIDALRTMSFRLMDDVSLV